MMVGHSPTRVRLFSLRHAHALRAGRIVVELSDAVRRRLWSTLRGRNETFCYSEPDNPSWTINSSTLEQVEVTLGRVLGIDCYDSEQRRMAKDLQDWALSGDAAGVFDLVEVFFAETPPESRPELQRDLNDGFVDFACPWRLSDGMVFRVDSEFFEQEVLERTADLLRVPQLEGAQAEFKTARDHLTDGTARDAIVYAAHSVESILKAALGQGSGVATDLLRLAVQAGLMDDIPTPKAYSVAKVLGTVAILRNELGGHGQGGSILEPPRPYAALAVHLAAAINLFLISQYLRKHPLSPPPPPPALRTTLSDDNEIPF